MIRFTELGVRLLGIAGALACAAIVIGIERTPIVWADEIVFTAASYNLARTGSTVPSHQTDIDSFLPPGRYYGPLYFRLTAAAISTFGLHPWSARLVCLLGGALAVIGAYSLARAAGVARRWAVAAASLVVLTPDFGSAATNGRMDMLAASLETTALAALWRALGTDMQVKRVAWSGAAGALLGLAFLTTPRTFPAALGILLASPILFLAGRGGRHPNAQTTRVGDPAGPHGLREHGEGASRVGDTEKTGETSRVAAATALGVIGGVSALLLFGWATVTHGSPVAWAQYVLGVTVGDTANVAPILGGRTTMFASPAVLTPIVGLIALALVVRQAHDGERSRQEAFFLTAVWAQAVAYCVLVSTPLLRSAYFAVPLAAVTFAVLTERASSASRRAVMLALVAGVFFAGGRALKIAELALTWEARDHARLEQFFRAHVPAGATVTGYDQFYFYAVENAGAHFRGYAVFGQLPPSERRLRFPDQTAGDRYFIWPDLPVFELVPDHRCATAHPIARFEAGRVNTLPLITSFPWLARFRLWRAYPPSVLYLVDEACRVDKVVFSVRGAVP